MPRSQSGVRDSGRALLVESWDWDGFTGLFLLSLPWLIFAYQVAMRGASVGRLISGIEISVPMFVFLFFFLYPLKIMRAAVWMDGFRPPANRIWHREWFRRRLRMKVDWGEVGRVKVFRDKYTGLESQVRLQTPANDALIFSVGLPDSRSEAELALLVLERWRLLGGRFEEEEW